MEAPLLGNSSGELLLTSDIGDYQPVKGLRAWWRVFCIETAKLWIIGGPIAFQTVCQFSTISVTTIFVGHLGDIELSAFSIALNVISTFAFGFLLGMGSALETLCGQAFGAGKIDVLGKLVGQQHEIANPAGIYTLLILPQLFSLAVLFPTQKFLQAQSKVSVIAWIAAFSLAAHVLLCWLFVYVFGWGTTGAAVAFDLTSWGTAIAQFVYVLGWCQDSWKGFSWTGIWAFLRLSLASAVMLCLEIWYMMSIVILTGHLDNAVAAVGSLNICMNINGWETMVFIGVNAAISVRVSNELGLGHPRAARYSVYTTLFQSLLLGILCMIVVHTARNYIYLIFTTSEDMKRAVAHLSPLLGVTMLLNSIQPVIAGVAIGGGWQALVAYINLGCYYIFGLPFGYYLGNMGGMIAGMTLQTLLLVLVLYRTNWNKEVEETTERMLKWGGQGK